MRFHRLLILILPVLSGCASSTLKPENDHNKNQVIEYCSGQIWGYFQTIYDLKGPSRTANNRPYQGEVAVFLYSQPGELEDKVAFNFVLDTKGIKTNLEFKEKLIKIQNTELPLEFTVSQLQIIKQPKRIVDLYSYDLYSLKPTKSPREWKVAKYKFGSRILTEKPFIVTLAEETSETVEFNDLKIEIDPKIHKGVYVRGVLPINVPHSDNDIRLEVLIPEYKINEKPVPANVYVFNYNRLNILKAMKESPGSCPAIETIFQWN